MDIRDVLSSVDCACQVCSPLDAQAEKSIAQFACLVEAGASQAHEAIRDEAASAADAARHFFARVEELNRTDDLEEIAEDLCKWPLNVNCRKVAALTELVRNAGFWGPLAANIQKGPTPTKKQLPWERKPE